MGTITFPPQEGQSLHFFHILTKCGDNSTEIGVLKRENSSIWFRVSKFYWDRDIIGLIKIRYNPIVPSSRVFCNKKKKKRRRHDHHFDNYQKKNLYWATIKIQYSSLFFLWIQIIIIIINYNYNIHKIIKLFK